MIAALFNPATWVLATACIQWLTFGASGLAAIPLVYFALVLVMVFSLTGPRKAAATVAFARQNALWLAPLTAYLLIVGLILRGSPIEMMVPRQFFFLLGSIALGAVFASSSRLPAILRVGSALAVALFIVAIELLARKIGLSWLDAIERFVRGEFNFVVFDFLRGAFNALDPTGDVTLGAATKNAAAVTLFVSTLLFRSGSKTPETDWLGAGMVVVAVGLLLMLNTRSVLIVAAASLMMTVTIATAMRPAKRRPWRIAKLIALAALMMVAVSLYLPGTGISAQLSDRFAFDDYSTQSRQDQFSLAVSQIETSPLTGTGYFEAEGHVIHNLFLAAWVHGGLAAFLLAITFYVGLILSWLSTVFAIAKRPDRWVIPIAFEWIAPLPLLPLFRVWLSGDAGNLFLGEWLALAAFFGCVLANRVARRKSRHRSKSGGGSVAAQGA